MNNLLATTASFFSREYFTLPQVTAAGTVSVLSFFFFDHICGKEPPTVGKFLITLGQHATIWTGAITTLVLIQKRWPMLSLIVGTTCVGGATLKALLPYMYRLSKEDDESVIMNALAITGIGVNIISTSYLLYQQPSGARAFHWTAILITIGYCWFNKNL